MNITDNEKSNEKSNEKMNEKSNENDYLKIYSERKEMNDLIEGIIHTSISSKNIDEYEGDLFIYLRCSFMSGHSMRKKDNIKKECFRIQLLYQCNDENKKENRRMY